MCALDAGMSLPLPFFSLNYKCMVQSRQVIQPSTALAPKLCATSVSTGEQLQQGTKAAPYVP